MPDEMKNIFVYALMLLLPAMAARGEKVQVSVKVPATPAYKEVTIVAIPAGKNYDPNVNTPLKLRNGVYTGSVEANKEGIYNFSVSNREMQYTLPIYLPAGSKVLSFRLTSPTLSTRNNLPHPANKAFSAFQQKMSEIAQYLGINAQQLSNDDIRRQLERYVPVADSISKVYKLKGVPAQYMKLWGWTSTCDSFNTASYLAGRAGHPLSFSLADIVPDASKAVDTPMAAWFYSTPLNVAASLKGNTVEEQLENLYANFRTPAIREGASRVIMDRFLGHFDYVKEFETGEKRLEALTEKYQLPDSYLKTFRSRVATMPGAKLPQVTLKDADGNEVSLDRFAGKYIYIDLWASWCGPCVKEVPHLQKLEEELKDAPIAFVSISTDTDTKPWKAKMEALKMHGNQYIDTAGELADKLNVRGIPHFLLYGPDGKLIKYSMTRPSDPKTAEFLKSLN